MAKREVQEINASSMADIAFLLLIFFLVTTTMDVDTGLMRQLPPIPDKDQIDTNVKINERDILRVLVNDRGDILVNGRPKDIGRLKEEALKFIRSDRNNEKLPQMEEKTIKGIPAGKNPVLVPQGIISLQTGSSTTYGKYVQVQDVLVAAYNEVRDEAAMYYFGKKSFDELNTTQQDAIKEIYPQKISEAEPKEIKRK